MKKGETRHGVLSREMNGVVCFDETDQRWLNNPTRRSVRLKKFDKFGTRVTRKAGSLIIKMVIPIVDDMSFDEELKRSNELADALTYCRRYTERRKP